MKRRVFLGAVGSLTTIGAVAYATRSPVDRLGVRFWLSSGAADYVGIEEKIQTYLNYAFDFEWWSVECSYGGVVDVSTEDGADVTRHGEWPAALVAGRIGHRSIDPAEHVNLLVTDGQMRTAPTGYGIPHVASVGGARHLSKLEPPTTALGVVPYTTPNRVVQVVIHEVGHALGLRHEHGVLYREGDSEVTTPMLSTYAWDPSAEYERSRCGTVYPDPDDQRRTRKLSLAFSSCARESLEAYRGGLSSHGTF